MMRISLPKTVLVLCGAMLSCTPGYVGFQHQVFPGLERYDDGALHGALETPIILPRAPRASLLWLDQSVDRPDSVLAESERTRLLDELTRALTGPPFSSVSVIPTTLTSHPAGSGIDLAAVRSAAAHLQSDVAILVLTTTKTTTEWNPLAVTYPALVTGLVVPGDDLRVDVSAQACTIDVRTGLFLDCVQGHADGVDRFVIPAWRASAARTLAATVAQKALADLPSRLRSGVDARMASGRVARRADVAATFRSR